MFHLGHPRFRCLQILVKLCALLFRKCDLAIVSHVEIPFDVVFSLKCDRVIGFVALRLQLLIVLQLLLYVRVNLPDLPQVLRWRHGPGLQLVHEVEYPASKLLIHFFKFK